MEPRGRGLDVGCDRVAPPVHTGKAGLGRRAVERERVQLVLPHIARLLRLPQRLFGLRASGILRGKLLLQIGQLCSQPGMLGVEQLNPGAPLGQLRAQIMRLFATLRALAPRAVDVFAVILNVGAQYRGAARLLGRPLLGFAQLLAQTIRLTVECAHILGQLLGLRV